MQICAKTLKYLDLTTKYMASVCVFCGANLGQKPEYAQAAKSLGLELARRGVQLIYGGGNQGLMGILSHTVMAAGGHVAGIIPERLRDIVSLEELSELVVTPGMHERKALMYQRADAFLVLPGGIGTLDEMAEVFTWRQLGYHGKTMGLLNIAGYFDPLLAMFDRMVEEDFMKQEIRSLLNVHDDPLELLDLLDLPPKP